MLRLWLVLLVFAAGVQILSPHHSHLHGSVAASGTPALPLECK